MSSSSRAIRETDIDVAEQTGVVIITYNHEEYIEDCLSSVLATGPGEVVVVDNESTDGTVDIIKNNFPQVELIQPGGNLGYGTSSNRGVEHVDTKYVVILNPDTWVKSDLLDELIPPLIENPRLITIPKIFTYDQEKINTIGNVVHFSGLAFTRGFGEPPEAYSQPELMSGLSGACFATTKETYEKMGGFEESIFIYMEDVEISWKANAMGFEIQYIPTASVFHDYPGIELDTNKLFHLERGRYIILRKYFSKSAVALLFPSLLMTELLTWGYATLHGLDGLKAKFRAIFEGLSADVEKVEIDTKELISRFDRQVPGDELRSSQVVRTAVEIANSVYEANVSLVQR